MQSCFLKACLQRLHCRGIQCLKKKVGSSSEQKNFLTTVTAPVSSSKVARFSSFYPEFGRKEKNLAAYQCLREGLRGAHGPGGRPVLCVVHVFDW